jgi:uncharacterized protein
VTPPGERRLDTGRALVLVYVAALIGAEATGAAVGAVPGAAFHAVVLFALLNTYAIAPDRPAARVLPVLALVPLLRLFSLTMPSRHFAEIWWYAMVGAPLLLAAFLATRAVPVAWPGLRLGRRALPLQAAIALAGAPLGLAAYGILTPAPLISPLTAPRLLGGAFILIVFSAFLEELIFRGLLQGAARELFGRFGLVIVSVLYASLYVGSLSAPYVGFVGVVGLMFAVAVERTGILWGAVGAHALMNIGLLLVWPTVL